MPKPKKKSTKAKPEPIILSAESLRLAPLTYTKLNSWSASVPFVIELQHPEVVLGIGFTVAQLRNLATEFLIACDKFEQYTENLVTKAMKTQIPDFPSNTYI